MTTARPPITHASDKGYPLCGAKTRPSSMDGKVESDVVSGMGPWDCERCLGMLTRAAGPVEAA